MKQKYIAIIPVRYASIRFPAKALAEIGGKPLFWHAYARAKHSTLFDDVYVATDDEQIHTKAKELNIPVILTSPHHQSGTDRVREAVQILGVPDSAVIANIQGDEPFLTKEMFAALLEPFQDSTCESATLGIILDEKEDADRIISPNQVKLVMAQNGNALYFSRMPIPYCRDGVRTVPYIGHVGVYAFRRFALEKMATLPMGILEESEKLEQLRLLENNIMMQVRLIKERPHGVDTPVDLDVARQYYNDHPEFNVVNIL